MPNTFMLKLSNTLVQVFTLMCFYVYICYCVWNKCVIENERDVLIEACRTVLLLHVHSTCRPGSFCFSLFGVKLPNSSTDLRRFTGKLIDDLGNVYFICIFILKWYEMFLYSSGIWVMVKYYFVINKNWRIKCFAEFGWDNIWTQMKT